LADRGPGVALEDSLDPRLLWRPVACQGRYGGGSHSSIRAWPSLACPSGLDSRKCGRLPYLL